MNQPVEIKQLHYLSEPDVRVIDGPLTKGYKAMLAGDMSQGKAILTEHLASVYKTRWHERTTEDYVKLVCRRMGIPQPANRESTPDDIILAAALERVKAVNVPLFKSIRDKGYVPEPGEAITMRRDGDKLLVGDGKNRVSILAALGVETVSDWGWIKYMTPDEYEQNAKNDPQWKSYRQRWAYHREAIAEIAKINPESVLEIGSFGCPLVKGSDTMDMPDGSWPTPWFEPTYRHDIRQFPWPVQNKRYDLLVALRVWHHLAPLQQECFDQARKIAKHLLIVCPEREVVGRGITRSEFDQWYGGNPEITTDLGEWGMLYVFRGI